MADVVGAGFRTAELPLPPDDEGPVVATLVAREPGEAARRTGRAVLYVHGYNDYFFQRELADAWDDLGYAFFALDLRKNGRSLRPWQTPSFVRHVWEYAAELDEAARRIGAAGCTELVVMGHSMGGLATSLWLHHREGGRAVGAASRLRVRALVLNSPFLDLPGTLRDRVAASGIGLAGRVRPYARVPRATVDVYARSLHADWAGEWRYDLGWKVAGGLPLRAGWLAAAREGQRAVRRGLAVDVPVLAMASTASYADRTFSAEALRADCVLDADRIAALAVRIGDDVTVVRVAGGLHDLVLSAPEVRAEVYAVVRRWLAERGLAEQGAAAGR